MLVYWRVSVHKENSIVVPCLAWLMDPLLVVTEPLVKTLKVARDDRHIPTFAVVISHRNQLTSGP